jgi:hypothetical protein
MPEWEYRIITVDLDQRNGIQAALEDANIAGSMSWGLVSVTVLPECALTSPGTGSLLFTYKRRKRKRK